MSGPRYAPSSGRYRAGIAGGGGSSGTMARTASLAVPARPMASAAELPSEPFIRAIAPTPLFGSKQTLVRCPGSPPACWIQMMSSLRTANQEIPQAEVHSSSTM